MIANSNIELFKKRVKDENGNEELKFPYDEDIQKDEQVILWKSGRVSRKNGDEGFVQKEDNDKLRSVGIQKEIAITWIEQGEKCPHSENHDTLLSCKGVYEIQELAKNYKNRSVKIQVAATQGVAAIESASFFHKEYRGEKTENIMVIPELIERSDTISYKHWYNPKFKNEQKTEDVRGLHEMFDHLDNHTELVIFTTKKLIEKQVELERKSIPQADWGAKKELEENLEQLKESSFMDIFNTTKKLLSQSYFVMENKDIEYGHKSIVYQKQKDPKEYVTKIVKIDIAKYKGDGQCERCYQGETEVNVMFFLHGKTCENDHNKVSCDGLNDIYKLASILRSKNKKIDAVYCTRDTKSVQSAHVFSNTYFGAPLYFLNEDIKDIHSLSKSKTYEAVYITDEATIKKEFERPDLVQLGPYKGVMRRYRFDMNGNLFGTYDYYFQKDNLVTKEDIASVQDYNSSEDCQC
jgi:hypothetical protein